MPEQGKRTPFTEVSDRGLSDRRLDFSHHILASLSRNTPRLEFLSEMLMLVVVHSGCDAVETWLRDGSEAVRCEACRQDDKSCGFTLITGKSALSGIGDLWADTLRFCRDRETAHATGHGSIWIACAASEVPRALQDSCAGRGYRWLALVPLHFGEEKIGVLLFKGTRESAYDPGRLEYLETLAAKFEMGLLHQLSRARLSERVKELTCLYGIARASSEPSLSFEQKMMNIVALLPPAWQYPSHACARIVIDGHAYQTPSFAEGAQKQAAPVKVKGASRGVVEVHYSGHRPFPQGKPFLDEEQSLINNVAGQIAQMVEREEAEAMRSELQDQLTRADRLAAIGQLAAGVAHELNEPLNTILGFAQLVQKNEHMPKQAAQDVESIVEASLHARTIIRELLIFARQDAPSRSRVNLNRIIEDELSLFESLCGKSCVELRRMLAPDLPEITANKSQLLQVISNLMINALQAMPEGGAITLTTSSDHEEVSLTVEDTGIGMSDEVKNNIFLPFFTTKDVDQGTGLGLAVVHGIVASHSGRIVVESTPGQGARFVLTFPHSTSTEPEEDQR
jgi:signal transduction histidine kinase